MDTFKPDIMRRSFLLTSLAAMSCPISLRAESAPLDLEWKDLRPRGSRGHAGPSQSLSHSSIPSRRFSDPRAFAVVKDYKGRRVRLPGFLIPLDLGSAGATEFLLVPFVGACIHVPPPPPNQIVHARSADPFQVKALFEPVYAVGVLDTVYAETELAQASYTLAVDAFEKVEF